MKISDEMEGEIISYIKRGHTMANVISFIKGTYSIAMDNIITEPITLGIEEMMGKPLRKWVELAHHFFSPNVFDVYFVVRGMCYTHIDESWDQILQRLSEKYNISYVIENRGILQRIEDFAKEIFDQVHE